MWKRNHNGKMVRHGYEGIYVILIWIENHRKTDHLCEDDIAMCVPIARRRVAKHIPRAEQ
jgi:hypothetical protein